MPKHIKKIMPTILLIAALVAVVALTGCSDKTEKESATNPTVGEQNGKAGGDQENGGKRDDKSAEAKTDGMKEAPKDLTEVKVQLGWFPEPEYGGDYAALAKGFFKDEGLDVELIPGAPGVNGIQLVATGKADFGSTKADKLLTSRADGIPIKAVAGVFQKSPQALMYHKGANIKSFEDLKGRTVFFVPGVFGYEYIKYKYKLTDLKEQVHDGSFARFLNDKESLVHGFYTSEVYTFKSQNIATGYLAIADSGYDPYEAVVFATEQYLNDKPDTVKAYLRALKKGWEYYRDHAEEINVTIHEANKELPLDAMKETARLELPLIFGGDAEKEGWGVMKEQRFLDNQKQLLEIGALKKEWM